MENYDILYIIKFSKYIDVESLDVAQSFVRIRNLFDYFQKYFKSIFYKSKNILLMPVSFQITKSSRK